MCYTALVLSMIFCMGEQVPYHHYGMKPLQTGSNVKSKLNCSSCAYRKAFALVLKCSSDLPILCSLSFSLLN